MSAVTLRRLAGLLAVLVVATLVPTSPAAAFEGRDVVPGTTRVLVELDAARGAASVGAARRSVLSELGAPALRTYSWLPFVAVEATAGQLLRLRRMPGVRSIQPDQQHRPTLEATVPHVGGARAWAAGATGSGQVVAVLDTGVETTHPFLSGKVLAEACFSGSSNCPNGGTSQTGTGAAAPCTYDAAACGHGTHVAGIVAGAGSTRNGVAKGASLIAVQVFSRTTSGCPGGATTCAVGFTSDLLAGLDHVATLAATMPVAAVNLSLGGSSYPGTCDTAQPALKSAVDRLRSLGVATVVSAGNAGTAEAMSSPACLSSVVAVGSTSLTDVVSSFSSSSTELDLLAPGQDVVSSFTLGRYARMTGTSQAAPHVAGAFAVLRHARPTATVTQRLAALTGSGPLVTDARNGRTTRRLSVDLALTALSSAMTPPPQGQPQPTTGPAPAEPAPTEPSPAGPEGASRLAGTDRFDTAATVFTAGFGCARTGGVSHAVLARGDAFADALAGSYLAGTHTTGVLLTGTSSVPAATLAALRTSAARTVLLLGGTSAISDAVAAQLAATPSFDCAGAAGPPLSVVRVAGADRYDTARLTAELAGSGAVGTTTLDGPARRTAVVASGVGFADALAAGPLSYAGAGAGHGDGQGFPTLLTGAEVLAPAAERALVALGIEQVIVPGGTAVVSAAVQARLVELGLHVVRLGGSSRTQTAALVADFAVDRLGFSEAGVALARGDNFADALAGAAYAGDHGLPMLLTASPTALSQPTRDYLVQSSGTSKVTAFGGAGAINDATLAAALEALRSA